MACSPLTSSRTGKFIKRMKLEPKGSIGWGGEIAIGPDRNLYFAGNNGLMKLDAPGRQIPFADTINQRILKAKLTYAAEQTAQIRLR